MDLFMNNYFKGFVLFFVGGFIGASIATQSWDGMVYFYPSNNGRQIASINKTFDFSHLQGAALKQASKERLVDEVKVYTTSESIGVELGHFVRKSENGRKEFACSSLNKVELHFDAVGIIESGHVPTLKVQGPCKVSKNLNRISALWIPVKEVLSSKPGDVELSFLKDDKINVSFKHVGNHWPQLWQLKSVKLFNENSPYEQVDINPDEMRQFATHPVFMNWRQGVQ